MVVAYDDVRGEPRGKIRKNEDQADKGDCVDCGLCVDVCPTGIDIRNGTQLECVNCTACIDACDSVMDKINKPRGLVRIDSINNIRNKIGFRFTPRIIAYTAVMVILVGVFIGLVVTRTDVEAHLLRAPGKTYYKESEDVYSNIYHLEMVNKTYDTIPIRFEVNYPGVMVHTTDTSGILPANEEQKRVLLFKMNTKDIKSNKTTIPVAFYVDGKLVKTMETTFLAPKTSAK